MWDRFHFGWDRFHVRKLQRNPPFGQFSWPFSEKSDTTAQQSEAENAGVATYSFGQPGATRRAADAYTRTGTGSVENCGSWIEFCRSPDG
ncbi:MAG: hypothetical protein ABIR04_11145 [Cypionkella sp.]